MVRPPTYSLFTIVYILITTHLPPIVNVNCERPLNWAIHSGCLQICSEFSHLVLGYFMSIFQCILSMLFIQSQKRQCCRGFEYLRYRVCYIFRIPQFHCCKFQKCGIFDRKLPLSNPSNYLIFHVCLSFRSSVRVSKNKLPFLQSYRKMSLMIVFWLGFRLKIHSRQKRYTPYNISPI